jgi:cytochrome P450
MRDFNSVTNEMSAYLVEKVSERRNSPKKDLLTRLLEAEVEDDRLTHEEILAFFRLLMFAGQETTTNLLNNAILSFLDHPDQLLRLRNAPQLLPSAIEEVLRYRSPFPMDDANSAPRCGGARRGNSKRRICASDGGRREPGPQAFSASQPV